MNPSRRSAGLRPVVFAFALAAALGGCRHQMPPLREPNSVESLCLGAAPVRQKAFKLPSIEGLRNDRLIRGQDLHLDVHAVQRVVAATSRELGGNAIDEDDAREFVTLNGGGVIVWWRRDPVLILYAPLDAKSKPVIAQVYAAAVAESPPWAHGRTLYLLERAAGTTATPVWRAFASTDRERACL